MPNCSFQCEISRDGIIDAINDVDAELTERGITVNAKTARISAIMADAVSMSFKMANGDVDNEVGVSEISIWFLYALVKQEGIEQLDSLVGLIGCVAADKLYLSPCSDDALYQEAITKMREAAQEMLGYDDDEFVDQTPVKPTIH
ncbi:unnamed protein product [Sphagnum tenellum]